MEIKLIRVEYDQVFAERLQDYTIKVDSIYRNGTGNGNIGMIFYLQRYSIPFLEKYYLPCVGLVILTSVSFFVPPKMVPGRGGMLVTLFLVLNNIFSASKVESILQIGLFDIRSSLISLTRMRLQYQKAQLI